MPYRCKLGVRRTAATFLLALLLLQGAPVSSAARSRGPSPSTSNPDKALWVNFEERVGKWRQLGVEASDKISEVLDSYAAGNKIGYKEVENAYEAMLDMQIHAKRLEAFGEPAGVDFSKRAVTAERQLIKIAEELAAQPDLKKTLERRVQKVPKAVASATKQFEAAQKLRETKQYERACSVRFEATHPIRAQHLWAEVMNSARVSTIKRWTAARTNWLLSMSGELRSEAQQLAAEWIENEKVRFEDFLKQIETAAAGIAASGKAQLDDGQIAGPALLEHFGQKWMDLQYQAYRWRGITAVSRMVGGKADLKAVNDQCAQFSTKIGPALASIINADAQRASPEEASELYFAYLEKLPAIISRAQQLGLTSLMQPALNSLAARNPVLVQEIEAYRAATSDLLRWQRRTVDAHLRVHSADYPSLITQVLDARQSKEFPLTSGRQSELLARLNISVPEAVTELGKVFLDKRATASNLLVTQRRGVFAVSQYQHRSLAYVPIDTAWFQEGYEHLARDLFVEGESTALTLEAQLALYGIRQGDLATAGGEITNVGLIGWTTRYLTLDHDDRGLIRLGPFFPEEDRLVAGDLILMFMIRPAWVTNPYLFVALQTDI